MFLPPELYWKTAPVGRPLFLPSIEFRYLRVDFGHGLHYSTRMKYWVRYLLVSVAGAAAVLFLPVGAVKETMFSWGSAAVSRAGSLLFLPFACIAFTSGIAALRRSQQTSLSLLYTVIWAAAAGLAITAVSAVIAWKGFSAPFVGYGGTAAVQDPAFTAVTFVQAVSDFFPSSGLLSLTARRALVPLLLCSLVVGVSMKPDEEYIRPAFAVLNSASEVFYRIAGIISMILSVGIFFLSGAWLAETLSAGTDIFIDSLQPIILLSLVTAGAVIVVLPLLLMLLGRTRRPYSWLLGLLAPAVLAFFSGSGHTAQSTLLLHVRSNVGAPKRIASTSTILLYLIGRSGTAAVSAVIFSSLFLTVTGVSLPVVSMVMAALFSLLFSFLAWSAPGLELLFVVTMTGKVMGMEVSSYLPLVLPLLPLYAGAAALIDTFSAGAGAGAVSRLLSVHNPVRVKDFI